MISSAGNVEFPNYMHDREKCPEYPKTSSLTITTDGWTSRDAKSFLTEAVHHIFEGGFLDRDEKLFCRKPYTHGHLSSAARAAVTLIFIHI